MVKGQSERGLNWAIASAGLDLGSARSEVLCLTSRAIAAYSLPYEIPIRLVGFPALARGIPHPVRRHMVKQGVIPDDLTRPFFEAANEGRLVVQACKGSERLYFPPRSASELGCSPDDVEWREVSGRGKIYNYCVVYDCPVASLKEDIPFNLAVIMLDEDPGLLMYSHLPGTAPDEVPVGASVRVIFEATANGQKVPEWEIVP